MLCQVSGGRQASVLKGGDQIWVTGVIVAIDDDIDKILVGGRGRVAGGHKWRCWRSKNCYGIRSVLQSGVRYHPVHSGHTGIANEKKSVRIRRAAS